MARDEGGEILTGGKAPSDRRWRGCYVEPTVVAREPGDRVCQEEVFGPFVTVTTFKDEEEVIGHRQRHGLRSGRRAMDRRTSRARIAWRRRMRIRHGLDQ